MAVWVYRDTRVVCFAAFFHAYSYIPCKSPAYLGCSAAKFSGGVGAIAYDSPCAHLV